MPLLPSKLLQRLLISANVPTDIFPHLCSAILAPIKKKNGGLKPIAVGEVLQRLTTKCLCKIVYAEIANILSPLHDQVGVGIPAGHDEIIVHTMNCIQEDDGIPHTFNSIRQQMMFEEAIRSRILYH